MGFSLFQSWPGSVGCWSPWTDHSIHTLTPTGNLDSPTNRGNWTKPNQTMEEHAEHNPEPFAISYNHISATCQAGLIFTSFLRYRLWFLSNRWSACHNFRFQQTPFKRSSSTSLSCSQGHWKSNKVQLALWPALSTSWLSPKWKQAQRLPLRNLLTAIGSARPQTPHGASLSSHASLQHWGAESVFVHALARACALVLFSQ